jgi:hypothetical protein
MKIRNFLFLFLAVILGACSSVQVTSDWDKTVDFTTYKTFGYMGWADNSDKILTPFDKERLEQSFADEFRKRGMTYQETGADVVVSLFIVVNQKTSTTAYTDYYGARGYGGYYGGWGWGAGHSTTTYNEYDYLVGTLVCDVFDATSKQLVWQGVGSGTINENANKREKTIPKNVAEIMYYYPVKPIK